MGNTRRFRRFQAHDRIVDGHDRRAALQTRGHDRARPQRTTAEHQRCWSQLAMILAGSNDPLVKFEWQERMMDAVRKTNGCDAASQSWNNVGTVYPSSAGTPLVTFIYPRGHAMDPVEPGLIVKFFHEHPKQ